MRDQMKSILGMTGAFACILAFSHAIFISLPVLVFGANLPCPCECRP